MDLGVICDSSSLNKMSQNGSHALPSPAHIFITSFLEIFFIEFMSTRAQKFPLKIFSVAQPFTPPPTTKNPKQMALLQSLWLHVQLFRLIMLSWQRVSKLPYLRVLCVEILLPEITAGPSRFYFFLPLQIYFRWNQTQVYKSLKDKVLERHILDFKFQF